MFRDSGIIRGHTLSILWQDNEGYRESVIPLTDKTLQDHKYPDSRV